MKNKINKIIARMKNGFPYRFKPVISDTGKEIGSYCYYFSVPNNCFQEGIWAYEEKVMFLHEEPQKYSEQEIRKKIINYQNQKK